MMYQKKFYLFLPNFTILIVKNKLDNSIKFINLHIAYFSYFHIYFVMSSSFNPNDVKGLESNV